MRSRRALALAAVALSAAGCTTQWYPGLAQTDVAQTDVVVHTEPPGAEIYCNGKRQSALSPIRIPVNYPHTVTVYERQSNRFLVYHYREEMKRHEYGGNEFVITAYLPGYDDAIENIKLEGEAEHPVTITLHRSQ